jgi:hypothetical protein
LQETCLMCGVCKHLSFLQCFKKPKNINMSCQEENKEYGNCCEKHWLMPVLLYAAHETGERKRKKYEKCILIEPPACRDRRKIKRSAGFVFVQ